jgi:sRNA-binding regulator protein Hfq
VETKDIVLLVAGIVIGGLVSWLISHIFYVKSSKSQELEFKKLIADIEAANTLEYFESR